MKTISFLFNLSKRDIMKLKLAIISDIHYGPNTFTKIGEKAHELTESFIEAVNAADYDLVVELGDRVTDVDQSTDIQSLIAVADLFRSCSVPCQHLLGNHDMVNMGREENEDILQCDMNSTYLDTDVVRLIFWRPEVRIKKGIGFPLLSDDLEWLEETLNTAPNKAVIFNHVPISGHSQYGNYYFQNNHEFSTYPEYERILELAVQNLNTAAWISGHVHWNTFNNMNGIPMITIQSLTECFTTYPNPSGAWAEVEISENQITCQIKGIDPLSISAPLIDRNIAAWHPPLGVFNENKTRG